MLVLVSAFFFFFFQDGNAVALHNQLSFLSNREISSQSFVRDGKEVRPLAGDRRKHGISQCIKTYAEELDHVRAGFGSNIRSHPLAPVQVSSKPLIIVASPGGTGTTSINLALNEIGLHSKHGTSFIMFTEVLAGAAHIKYCPDRDWTPKEVKTCLNTVRTLNYASLLESSTAVMDTPVSELFIDIFLAFPNAKVIYADRPTKDWVATRQRAGTALLPLQEPCGQMLTPKKPMNVTDEDAAGLFDLHAKFVRCIVPEDQLFTYNLWTDPKERLDDLVAELAAFVGKPSTKFSNIPFPHEINMPESCTEDGAAIRCDATQKLACVTNLCEHELTQSREACCLGGLRKCLPTSARATARLSKCKSDPAKWIHCNASHLLAVKHNEVGVH